MTGPAPHACTAWCRPPEHAEVVYVDDADDARLGEVAEYYRNTLGVELLRITTAPEAPPHPTNPTASPHLVWFREDHP